MSKAHHGILWETTKAICHSEAIVWENLLRSMHISLSWEVFNNMGYLLGHTDASKAQCIDCGKLLSLGSNKPGKQTVHGLKCVTKVSIHCTWGKWNPVNKAHLQKRRNWTRYRWRIIGLTWWLNVRKRKKNTNIIRWLSFSFSADNKCPSTISFRFRP